jgi:molecular chaperone DnaK
MTAVGIDFGTTNSVVATWSPSGTEAHHIDAADGEWLSLGFDRVMPSVFAHGEDGGALFGWKAKRQPGRRFEAVKRLFATQQELVTDGSGDAFAVEEVATMLFAEMKRALREQGVDGQQAVITVPANSRGVARHRTKTCAGMGGFEVLMLLNEPTAAAMAYAAQHPGDQQILVFDWGGGTLDVTVLQALDGIFLEKASKGLPTSGGIDFDHRFARSIVETVPNHRSWDDLARHRFRLGIEVAKIKLSDQDETELLLPDGTTRRLTRAMYENAVRPLIEESRQPIERCLADLGVGPGAIDAVVMVGGTSKIPAVRSFVSEIMGTPPASGIDGMTAVGEGAAIAAAILTEELTTNDFVVSTEHALGTVTFDPQTQTEGFSVLIPRNMMLPAEKTDVFVPVVADTESVNVRVIEGDPEAAVNHPDNVILQSFPLPVPGQPGDLDRSFEITYRYDNNGILHVEATDPRSSATLLRQEISFGVSADRRELVKIAGRARETVETGRVERSSLPASVTTDAETAELLQRAHVKVLPFLDEDEAVLLRKLVAATEEADPAALPEASRELRAALAPYSYLF